MKYKKRVERISKAVSKFEDRKSSTDALNDALNHFRPMMTRYAESATNDRLMGNIQRWQHQSFVFIASAYCTYLRDKEEIPQFVENLMEQRHVDYIKLRSNDKGYYLCLWVAMKIIVPEWLDYAEGIDE